LSEFVSVLTDLLKLDCEGCEWEALVQAAVATPELLERICTIVLEVHFTEELQLDTERAVMRVAQFFDIYVRQAGFRFWYLHANPGGVTDRSIHPEMLRLGLPPGVCCYVS
jgi:hypothetical protein